MDFENRIWHFYRTVCVSIENTFEPLLTEEGLSLIQARILFEILNQGGLSVGELSALIRMNAGNCSTMCKKLEARDFLVRERKKDDERYVVLSLTPQGKACVSRIFERAKDRQRKCLSKIGAAGREEILIQLGRLEEIFAGLNESCLAQQEEEKNGK
ncbi:MarR family winged helix-turn-helix transcriptional regulator [Synergistaceae bacterium OttesenSCG-928-D05]|nr:MarR family winged helix-turn-helix transcriptional regulator [Synergistaceae bacterium OttesenSCG-928-D05]